MKTNKDLAEGGDALGWVKQKSIGKSFYSSKKGGIPMKKLVFLSLIIFVIFSQHCKNSPTAPEIPAVQTVKTGEWTATADFGTFDIIVSSGSNFITKITFNFASWTCGPVNKSGVVSVSTSPGWPISNRSFEIAIDFNSNEKLTIKGTFSDNGVQVSGTWNSTIYGSTCSGSWQGSPKS